MTSAQERAARLFDSGFSCSQAVFGAFSEALGIELTPALKIAQPFGGGIAGSGSTCGAISGALLVIGLRHGRSRPEDLAAKEQTYTLVREFIRRFQEHHGSTLCRELLGVDLSTPEGHEEARRRGLFAARCSQFVAEAAAILEEIL
jgi:C_GCAxxG_C_C family probable redox protein